MRDIVTPVTQDEVKTVIRRCLEQAALVNYQRLSEYAKLEGTLVPLKGFPHLSSFAGFCLNFLVNSGVT